jgi:hypothetical protein
MITRLPLHHLPFNTLREPKAARSVLAHGKEEKKEFLEKERAQTTTLLGATFAMSPGRTMGKAGDY